MNDEHTTGIFICVSKWHDKVSWHLTTYEAQDNAISKYFGPYRLSLGENALPDEVKAEIVRREAGPPVLPADIGIPDDE